MKCLCSGGGWYDLILLLVLFAAGSVQVAQGGERVAEIRDRNVLNCGIWPHVPGFAAREGEAYVGFEIDLCRAIATTILGDASKVDFVTIAHVEELNDRPEIDLVVRRLTRTAERAAATQTIFGPVVFHDGQGFLVPRRDGIRNAADLKNAVVCVIDRERHPRILFEHFQRENWPQARMLLVQSDAQAERELREGRCAAYSADLSWLAAARVSFVDGLSAYDILSDMISDEPLAPLTRAADTDLMALIRMTILALVAAEELGINSRNAGTTSLDSEKSRALAAAIPVDTVDEQMRLTAVVEAIGNYGEIYERNLGKGSSIELTRGRNRPCSQGGLICATVE